MRSALDALHAELAATRVRDGEVAPAQLRRLEQLADDDRARHRPRRPRRGDRARTAPSTRPSPRSRTALSAPRRATGCGSESSSRRRARSRCPDVATIVNREHRELLAAIVAGDGERAPPRGPARPARRWRQLSRDAGLTARASLAAIDRGRQEPLDARSAATGSGLPLSHSSASAAGRIGHPPRRVRLGDHEHAAPVERRGDRLDRLQVHAAGTEHRIRVGDRHERARPPLAQADQADEVPDRPVRLPGPRRDRRARGTPPAGRRSDASPRRRRSARSRSARRAAVPRPPRAAARARRVRRGR